VIDLVTQRKENTAVVVIPRENDEVMEAFLVVARMNNHRQLHPSWKLSWVENAHPDLYHFRCPVVPVIDWNGQGLLYQTDPDEKQRKSALHHFGHIFYILIHVVIEGEVVVPNPLLHLYCLASE
jgi:hypothetical protein